MVVLMLTTVLPSGRRGGGEIVSQGIVDALARAGRDVRVLGYRRSGSATAPAPQEVAAGTRPIETSAAGLRAAAWGVRAVALRAPYSEAKYRSRAYVRAAQAAADGAQVVVADHAQVAFAVEALTAPAAPLVFVAHNAEARLYGQAAQAAPRSVRGWLAAREARLIAGREQELARRARQVWVLSPDDADYFRAAAPGADVRVLAPPSRIAGGDPVEHQYDVALIGNWAWEANARGLRWFVDRVLPLLRRDLTIRVAGAGCDWLRGAHANVEVLGLVPDAESFQAAARVIAVPAVAGGGVQVKTLDAIATGLPVVATPTATRGLDALPGSVVIAGEAAEFAQAIERAAATPAVRGATRAEAVEWSRTRRERFDDSIAEWIAELTGAPAAAAEPVATVAEGSSTRLP